MLNGTVGLLIFLLCFYVKIICVSIPCLADAALLAKFVLYALCVWCTGCVAYSGLVRSWHSESDD